MSNRLDSLSEIKPMVEKTSQWVETQAKSAEEDQANRKEWRQRVARYLVQNGIQIVIVALLLALGWSDILGGITGASTGGG